MFSGGGSQDQPGRDKCLGPFGKPAAAFDQLIQGLDAAIGDIFVAMGGGGQGRTGEARERVIVMGGDAQGAAFGAPDPEATLVTGRQQPDGQAVIAAQDGVTGETAGLQRAMGTLAADFLERPALAIDPDQLGLVPGAASRLTKNRPSSPSGKNSVPG